MLGRARDWSLLLAGIVYEAHWLRTSIVCMYNFYEHLCGFLELLVVGSRPGLTDATRGRRYKKH